MRPREFLTAEAWIQEVQVKDHWEDLEPLLIEHHKEVALFQDSIDLHVDKERYEALQQAGILKAYLVFDWFGLCGYNVFIVNKHMHYADNLFAVNDVMFIDPIYRGGPMALRMVEWCEQRLKEENVSVIVYHMKTYKPFRSLMKTTSHEHVEEMFAKRL